ncbi:flavin reductase family protein [soil metagenome]
MRSINPKDVKTQELHAYMLGAIAPRPIAFVSSIDKNGQPNLSPFSFFNAFGSNPPLLIFSPALRGRDGSVKHTLENVRQVDDVVVNIVNYNMVQQMSLASTEYAKGVNEFEKAGFTAIPSELVKAPRVKEAPVQIECKVRQVIETGVRGGAANLVICEIVMMHIDESVLDEKGLIDPHKIDQVARLGGDWYTRAAKGLFVVPKPLATLGIGIDQLPEEFRTSKILSGNDLGMLGNTESLPLSDEIKTFAEREEVRNLFDALQGDDENLTSAVHLAAHELLSRGEVKEAWLLLLSHHKK